MQTPEEVWSEIEDGFDSVTQWGISDDQRARVAALIRARDAEVRADERAKVLAGFTEESRVVSPARGWAYPATHERRLVSAWWYVP